MPSRSKCLGWSFVLLLTAATAFRSSVAWSDGIVMPPRNYAGSLEERSQEAIIVFEGSTKNNALEHLILKIQVVGEIDKFAWVIPLPDEPTTAKADARLFRELFDYVMARRAAAMKQKMGGQFGKFGGGMGGGAFQDVTVLSREVVGSYDVAVVRENTPGKLNEWLEAEGYRPIADGEDVIAYYRRKGYVFACVKVAEANLKRDIPVDIHPLRFTFKTGGNDGIYFPMKMTALQKKPFGVNLYVFYHWWLNGDLNRYGYEHRGFKREYRDWDGPYCVPDAGKNWAHPKADPFLRDLADRIPTVAGMFAELCPKSRFYLTNISAHDLDPADVRKWREDLWLFPYYLDKHRIPDDVRRGGPAEGYEE